MKNILSKLIIASTITFFSIGCGGGGGDAPVEKKNVVFSENQKSFLYGLFKTKYLWASQIPDVNYSTYQSAREMIDGVTMRPLRIFKIDGLRKLKVLGVDGAMGSCIK